MFSIMTSYARARAESLIDKCKVGFMERPERIVLFMIGAFTDRMAAVLWVILILSIVTVANRIHYTYLALNDRPVPAGSNIVTKSVLAGVLLAGRTDDPCPTICGSSRSWRSSGSHRRTGFVIRRRSGWDCGNFSGNVGIHPAPYEHNGQ